MATGSAARHHRDCALRAVNGDETCLDNIRLFAKLPGDAKGELLDSVVHSSYPQGSIVVHEGDPIDSILIVHKGRIKTFRVMQDGEERVLDVLHDGQAIWHGLFLEDHVYHYSVGCLSDVQFCSIKRTAFEKVLERHPDVALSLIQMLSTELDEAEERAALLSVHNPRVRLAGFLLYREHRCMGDEIHLRLSEIAGSVNLRVETVSRVIAAMEREGLVERLGRGRIRIIDHDRLREISESE